LNEAEGIYIHLDLPYHPAFAKYRQTLDAGLRHLNIDALSFIAIGCGLTSLNYYSNLIMLDYNMSVWTGEKDWLVFAD
jgi:hypothetical protein